MSLEETRYAVVRDGHRITSLQEFDYLAMCAMVDFVPEKKADGCVWGVYERFKEAERLGFHVQEYRLVPVEANAS